MARKPRPRKPRRIGPPLPPPVASARVYLKIAPSSVGMFRFLLEAYDNLALFTVLDKREALLKVVFSPHQERQARAALAGIGDVLPIEIIEFPNLRGRNRATSCGTAAGLATRPEAVTDAAAEASPMSHQEPQKQES